MCSFDVLFVLTCFDDRICRNRYSPESGETCLHLLHIVLWGSLSRLSYSVRILDLCLVDVADSQTLIHGLISLHLLEESRHSLIVFR